ncbi:MAG: rRNA maturation RNase YbeY [Ruminococcaceae bacterium]|nr:rRNA maturation RNase YbeY [Oscillospiraceae bacterium]
MEKVKVTIMNKQRAIKIPTGIRMLIRRACTAVLAEEGFLEPAEVDVSFVDDKQIKELNAEFRNIDASTDVLSFPLGEDGVYDENPATKAKLLGDVIISVEHAVRQAEEYGHSFQREMAFLTVHSMLHLLGYDHVGSQKDSEIMREKEESVLIKMGLSREVTFTE